MRRYNGRISNALMSLFPEKQWNMYNFSELSAPVAHWESVNNQRAAFGEYAVMLNIKEPKDWYKVRTQAKMHSHLRSPRKTLQDVEAQRYY